MDNGAKTLKRLRAPKRGYMSAPSAEDVELSMRIV
jgi:hypothetical protein